MILTSRHFTASLLTLDRIKVAELKRMMLLDGDTRARQPRLRKSLRGLLEPHGTLRALHGFHWVTIAGGPTLKILPTATEHYAGGRTIIHFTIAAVRPGRPSAS